MRDQNGFTLVEVMVVGGLLMMMALGLTMFSFRQSQAQRAQEIQQNTENLKQNIVDASSQPETLIQSEQYQFHE